LFLAEHQQFLDIFKKYVIDGLHKRCASETENFLKIPNDFAVFLTWIEKSF
jgi:hypothetical protein